MGTIQGQNVDLIFFYLVYNPPDVPYKKNSAKKGSYCCKIIMGDFNVNLLSTESDTRFLLDLETHFATHPGTWIDAIFVGINDAVLTSDNRPAPYHNRHNIIDVILDVSTPVAPSDSFKYRAFNEITAEALNSALTDCDWSLFDYTIPDLESLPDNITTNVTAISMAFRWTYLINILRTYHSPILKIQLRHYNYCNPLLATALLLVLFHSMISS